MTHAELVKRATKWLKHNQLRGMRFPIVLAEFGCYADSIPDAIGLNHYITAVVECKVSRSDFLADQKKYHRGKATQLGNYRFYLCPPDLISADEVPEKWGLLYCHPHKITVQKEALGFPREITRPQEYQVMYSVIRRLTYRGTHDKMLEILRA